MSRLNKRLIRPYLALFKAILICSGLLAFSSLAHGQGATGIREARFERDEATSKVKKLESFLAETRAKHGLPALWAAKANLGEGDIRDELILAASGVRKANGSVQVGTEDLIHLGSCTKAMTATLIAQLISSGRLDWDTSLKEIFRDVEQLQTGDWGRVTVRQLLEHRSGAPKDLNWYGIQREHPNAPIAARRAVLKWLLARKRPAEPQYSYSNIGYCLLGHIVEHLEQESWEKVIQAKLFIPLQMNSAGFGPVKGREDQSQPWGHEAKSSVTGLVQGLWERSDEASWEPKQFDNAVPLGPAGRCHMKIQDWAKFVTLYASSNPPIAKIGIKEDVWQELNSTKVEDGMRYAGGWILVDREWGGGEVLNHAGSNTTWFCVAWVAPNREFFVLVATNCFGTVPPKACDRVTAELITSKAY